MKAPLFRPEVLEARNGRWLGTIILARPVPMRLAALVAALLVAGLITFLLLGVYTSRVRVSGQLIPAAGVIQLAAPQFGRVIARHIREGEHVKAGQVLFELSSARIAADGDIDARIQASLTERRGLLVQEQQLQARQTATQEQALAQRQALSRQTIERLRNEIALQRSRIDASAAMLSRYQALHEQGFMSQMQLMQHQSEHSEQQSHTQTLERALLEAQRDLTQIGADMAQVRSQASIQKVQSERILESLIHEAAEQEGRQRIQVTAPADGIATVLLAIPGQTVSPGAQLATIVPDNSELEAHLYAPTSAIGFVEEGQQVRLMIAAFPYQKYGYITGAITRIEQDAIRTEAATQTTSPVYRITASVPYQTLNVNGKVHRLLPGMALQADIRQEKRSLIEWLLAPVLPAAQAQKS